MAGEASDDDDDQNDTEALVAGSLLSLTTSSGSEVSTELRLCDLEEDRRVDQMDSRVIYSSARST